MSTATPGPWKVGRSIRSRLMGSDQVVEIQDQRDQMVALLYTDNRGGDEDGANARLLAAAPDLLAALKAVVSRHDGYQDGLGPCVCEGHVAARAAIAKAEGQS